MKSLKLLVTVVSLAATHTALRAATVSQPIEIEAIGYYQATAVTNGNFEKMTVRTVHINDRSIVRAIGQDLGQDLSGGRLLHKIDLGTNTSSIVVRKGTNEVDVSSFFTFTSGPVVEDSIFNNGRNGFNHVITYGLRSMSVTTSNLSLSLSGFGTAAGRTVSRADGTNSVSGLVTSLNASGAGTFQATVDAKTLSGPARGGFAAVSLGSH